MKSCPDCGSHLKHPNATACSCGWGKAGGAGMSQSELASWEFQRKQTLKVEEARETKKARDWLHDRGICDRKLEGPERRMKLQAYMKTLHKEKPGKDWAHSIIESYEAGDYMHEYAYRLACDATHREPVKVDRGEPF